MMRDAAQSKFDLIVPFDVKRFARDGVDILGNAKALKQLYVLTGFVRCAHCGIALTGNTSTSGRTYYRHCIHGEKCVFNGVPAAVIADKALEYLFWVFTDEPAFNKAVALALPDASQRQELEQDLKAAKHRFTQAQKQRDKLAEGIANGAALDLVIAKQHEVLAQLDRESKRVESLTEQIESMPSPELVAKQAEQIRKQLLRRIEGRDWRLLPFEEVKAFLIYLFGENPDKNGNGIKLAKEGNNWRISFKGNVEFRHQVLDDHDHRYPHGKLIVLRNNAANNGDSARVNLTQQT